MKVIIMPEVREYMKELQVILYEKDYFGFEETAQKYTDELLDNILNTIYIRLHKPAPKYFNKYGKDLYYTAFKKNKHTTWYAFFTKYRQNEEFIYLIRYIANNHTIAKYL